MDVLKIQNISVNYGEKNILNDISFSVKKGEVLGIIGKNGSGKSTLGKVLAGIEKLKQGKVEFLDSDVDEKKKELRERISIVFQNPNNQIIGNTVEDDLAFALENRGVSRDEMKARIKDIARMCKLENYLEKNPNELSGGQKQLLAIGGVVIFNPEIIIFDEITSMLDSHSKKNIRNIIGKLKDSHTIIKITHDPEDLITCDRLIVLDKGRIIGEHLVEEFFSDKEIYGKYEMERPFIKELESRLVGEKIEKIERVKKWINALK